MDKTKLKFGLLRSKKDDNEKLVCFNYEHIDIPIKFSLKDKVKQVYNQGEANSCSANSTANALQMSDIRNCIHSPISRLYLYFCTRYLDNNKMLPITDSGATLKAVFDALISYHTIPELNYVYNLEKINNVPPQHIFMEAINKNLNPIISYRRVYPSKYSFKYILYKLKRPILCGMLVYSNFMKLTKENPFLSLPNKDVDECLGGHAVVIISYDDVSGSFGVLNSHGSDFADNGYFYLPYEYALNPELAFEFYVINGE